MNLILILCHLASYVGMDSYQTGNLSIKMDFVPNLACYPHIFTGQILLFNILFRNRQGVKERFRSKANRGRNTPLEQ